MFSLRIISHQISYVGNLYSINEWWKYVQDNFQKCIFKEISKIALLKNQRTYGFKEIKQISLLVTSVKTKRP